MIKLVNITGLEKRCKAKFSHKTTVRPVYRNYIVAVTNRMPIVEGYEASIVRNQGTSW